MHFTQLVHQMVDVRAIAVLCVKVASPTVIIVGNLAVVAGALVDLDDAIVQKRKVDGVAFVEFVVNLLKFSLVLVQPLIDIGEPTIHDGICIVELL